MSKVTPAELYISSQLSKRRFLLGMNKTIYNILAPVVSLGHRGHDKMPFLKYMQVQHSWLVVVQTEMAPSRRRTAPT